MDAKHDKLKTDGSNYVPWAFRVETSLGQGEVWAQVRPVADGGTVRPPLGAGGAAALAAIRVWDLANNGALKIILKGLNDETVRTLTDLPKLARSNSELEHRAPLRSSVVKPGICTSAPASPAGARSALRCSLLPPVSRTRL